jgi:hypothetical protein
LQVLGYLWAWASADAFPLEARLISGEGLTQNEIVSRIYPWLRRNFKAAGNVHGLVVSPSTVAFRLNVASSFVVWHLECAMLAMPVGSPDIRNMRDRLVLIERSFASAAKARLPSAVHAPPLRAKLREMLAAALAQTKVNGPILRKGLNGLFW